MEGVKLRLHDVSDLATQGNETETKQRSTPRALIPGSKIMSFRGVEPKRRLSDRE